MGLLSQFLDWLPLPQGHLPQPTELVEQLTSSLQHAFTSIGKNTSIRKAVLAAIAATGPNIPFEFPYYGRSPAVYPSRRFSPPNSNIVEIPQCLLAPDLVISR